ncbi:hypothetical protein H6G03_34785 [Planktothrix sp. FACHB-1375]|uniref:Calx-beta domain-containing protein n=2 Tax=Oscillatoriophycideae TaxID=1301283 RepID=A0A926VLJ7_9CYAN|nr:hypothetical protein [Aerosakkonema funiforme FACHB-1375]
MSVNLAIDSSSTLTSNSGGTFPIDYNFSVAGGGSISGTGTTRTLIIPAGQSSVDLTLTPINDTHAEADETLKLNLATGDYSIDAVKNTGTVTVAANDTEVINLNDSVNDYKLTEGSLRQALLNAITFAGADTITFSGAGASGTINLVDELPNITGSNANNTTIDGPGANILTVQRSANPGTPKFGIFTFTNVTGAIDGLKIANGDRIGGSPTNGGGITNNAGTVTISDSIISNNKALIGGGIYNYGTMTVRNSTISDNYASSQIGGIANAGNNGDVLTIINSTISGNKAEGRYGGIATANLGTTMNLFNSTIYNNSAGIGQGGVYTNGTAVYAKNTIIAGNIAPSDPDFSGTLTSEGYNLIGNSSGASITGNTTGNIVGTPGTTINPKLDPLQNNGGSTPTHALQSDSPAINAGDPSFAPPPNTDQRGTGFDRVFGGRIDIGAFESKLTPALPQLSINDVTVTEGNFGSVSAFFTVTLSSKSSSSVSVKYTTADNTAVAGSDYSFSTGTITFAPNETTKTIFVPIQSDTAYETTEKFAVTLSNPTNAEINDGVGEGTIIDNDNFPTITINDITVTPPKTGTVDAVFTVTLSNPSSFPISVDFATANDTATTPEDYVNSSGKLTFDPGQVSKTIPVQVKSPPPPPTPLPSEIRGTSWNDSDKDGVRDLGEPGLANRTIFLDKNQNGILNASETYTTTDANGNYAFTNLMPGGYTVAQLSQVGWTQTFPSNSSPSPSVLIPVSNRRDQVFDPTRNLLYITTSDGKVQRYNVVTKTLLSAFNVGTSLNGADITPDGNFLYVAENQTSGGQGFFRKVNLSNGAVTNIPYNLAFGEAGAWDVEIAANGKGLATTDYSGSGWTPLRELNTATDTLSIRTDAPGSGFGEVRQRTHISRSADRSFFFLTESNISSGPIFTYDPNGEGQEKFNLNLSNATNANILDDRGVGTIKADQFPSKGETNTFHSNALSSLNRDGSLIALESYPSDIVIRDKSLNPVKTLTGYEGGMVFDSKRDILYAANVSTDRIVAFDTNSWNQLYTLNIGENINGDDSFGWNFGSGLMSVSDDGKYLFMSTPSGVRMFDLPQLGSHAVTLGSGQVVNAIDFGSSV